MGDCGLVVALLMIYILHYRRDPKLWELCYIPYYWAEGFTLGCERFRLGRNSDWVVKKGRLGCSH